MLAGRSAGAGTTQGPIEAEERRGTRAYTRRQAAEALGVSVPTIDRRVVPAINTVKTEWGMRTHPCLGAGALPGGADPTRPTKADEPTA